MLIKLNMEDGVIEPKTESSNLQWNKINALPVQYVQVMQAMICTACDQEV